MIKGERFMMKKERKIYDKRGEIREEERKKDL